MAGSPLLKKKSGRKPTSDYKPEIPMRERMPWPEEYFGVEWRGGSSLGNLVVPEQGKRIEPHRQDA